MEPICAGGRPRHPRRLRRPRATLRSVGLLSLLVAIGAAAVPTGLAGQVVRAVTGAPAADGPLPPCQADDVPATRAARADWARTLLDPTFRLEPDDGPADLVPVTEAGIRGSAFVRLLVIDDLRAMAGAARADGVRLTVRSGYRSYDDQVRTVESLEAAHGSEWTALSAALPGHSEHQLGTALDLDGGDAWLAANAWRHGFVVSYPPDRSPAFTCYKPEPWHVRYVGRAEARAVHDSGLSLREWLWIHGDEP